MDKGAWSQNGRAITEAWLAEGLKDRGITRDLKWGVPVPLPGFENKVLYVWFEACIGYPSITANYTTEWEKWWRDPENVRLYQFLGKDNVPFHSVIFPGFEIGTRETWTRLHHLSTTEYLNYENGKFSKSRGVGVFGNNAKDTGIDPDVWRYYLLKNRPETGDTQFEWRSFIDANNGELLAKLGNFVNRVIKLVNSKSYDSVIPHFSHSDPAFTAPLKQINDLLIQYNSELESVRLRAALATAMKIAEAGNHLIQSHRLDNKLVANEPERAHNIVGISLNLIYLCSSVFFPYLPATSAKILEQLRAPFLSIPSPDEDGHSWTPDALMPGHTIGKAKHLFSPIQDSKEEEWRAMFGGTQAERLKKEQESAKKAAIKAVAKAKKAEKKKKAAGVPGPVEATARPGDQEANGVVVVGDAVEGVTDGVRQVTLPTS
jgi:methionyl-tRNA synthetase